MKYQKTELVIAFFGLMLFALSGAFAQTDAFALEYATIAEQFNSMVHFDKPLSPTPELSGLRTAKLSEPLAGGSGSNGTARYSLLDLLELASINNPSLLVAKEAESAALADLRSAKARRLPTVKVETSGSFIGNPIGPISITKGQFGSEAGVDIPPRDILLYKGMENSNYSFKLTGDQPLFTWGKIKLGIKLAESAISASSVQKLKAERELAIKLRGTWEAMTYFKLMFDIMDLQTRIGNRLVELAEKSATAGFITQTDYASSKIKLKEIDIARVKLEEKRDRLLSELAAMAGLDELTMEDLMLNPETAGKARWQLDEALSLAMAGSLDLSLLDTLLDIKLGLKELAEKESRGLPDLGLHIELSYGGSRLPFIEKDWFRQDDYQLSISLGTSGNIFGNAVKAGEAAKARAELAEAVAQKADAERSIKAFIKESFLGTELGKAKLEHAVLKQYNYIAELKQGKTIIEAGAGSEPEYLTKMIEALANLAEAYATLIDYRSSLLSMEAIIGAR